MSIMALNWMTAVPSTAHSALKCFAVTLPVRCLHGRHGAVTLLAGAAGFEGAAPRQGGSDASP